MSKIENFLKAMGIPPWKYFRRGDTQGTSTLDQTKGLPKHAIKGRDGDSGGYKIGKPLDSNRSQRNDETPSS